MNGDGQNLYQENKKRINDLTNLEISKLIKKLDEQINVFREGKLLPDEVMKNVREASEKYSKLGDRVAKILSMDIQEIINFWKKIDKHIVDFDEEKWPTFKQENLKEYIDLCDKKRGFFDGLDESDQQDLKQRYLQYDTTIRTYDNLRLYRERAEKYINEIQGKLTSEETTKKEGETTHTHKPGGIIDLTPDLVSQYEEKALGLLCHYTKVEKHPQITVYGTEKMLPDEYWIVTSVRDVEKFLVKLKGEKKINIGDIRSFMKKRLRGKKGGKISDSFKTEKSNNRKTS